MPPLTYKNTDRLGIPLDVAEDFAESLLNWFIKVLQYYDRDRWVEKVKDKKKPRTKNNLHWVREGMKPIPDYSYTYSLPNGVKAKYEFHLHHGPWDDITEGSEYLTFLLNQIQKVLREISPDQYKRIKEIRLGRNSL